MLVETQETNGQYHADIQRLSNSMLSVLAKRNGPQLFDGFYISKTLPLPEQTESMALGEMVHCLVLEPMQFCHRFATAIPGLDRVRTAGKAAWNCFESDSDFVEMYVAKPEINRRTNEGKREWELFCESTQGKTILDRDDFETGFELWESLETTRGKKLVKRDDVETAEACANAILTHDSLSMINTCEAMIEKRIDFELDGVPMRCKPDWVSLDLQLIIDVKTTQDASPAFAKSTGDYGYYRQAWLYREALRLACGVDCRFLFACVETSKPYSVACYEPTDAMMRAGENDVKSLLAEYRYRYESSNWMQDWSTGINPLDLPKWFTQRNFYDEMRTQ